MGGRHLVEGGHAIAGLELVDARTDLLDDAGDVVALVHDLGAHVGELPVLRVGTGYNHLDQDLVFIRLGGGRVDDLDLRAWLVLLVVILRLVEHRCSSYPC
jgi:hypothetical protein